MVPFFTDRFDAGEKLAARLQGYARREAVVVLGLPRGGVPVAFKVSESLKVPLDIFIVRKLGVPGEEELAMGAIASGGIVTVNEDVLLLYGITREALEDAVRRETRVIVERERLLRGDRPPLEVSGRTVILVDDGLATGSTMRAAVRAVRRRGPAGIAVAVPVAPPETCEEMRAEADDVICLETPADFTSVGTWYRDFGQTSDREVKELLEKAALRQEASAEKR
jgi:putative phosphoribosyl transferase